MPTQDPASHGPLFGLHHSPFGQSRNVHGLSTHVPSHVVADLAARTRVLARIRLARAEPAALALGAIDAGAAPEALAAQAILVRGTLHVVARVGDARSRSIDAVLIRGAPVRIRRAVVRQALAGLREALQPDRAGRDVHTETHDGRCRSPSTLAASPFHSSGPHVTPSTDRGCRSSLAARPAELALDLARVHGKRTGSPCTARRQGTARRLDLLSQLWSRQSHASGPICCVAGGASGTPDALVCSHVVPVLHAQQFGPVPVGLELQTHSSSTGRRSRRRCVARGVVRRPVLLHDTGRSRTGHAAPQLLEHRPRTMPSSILLSQSLSRPLH